MVYLKDKYAIRYLDTFLYRCEVFKFYFATATYSDTVAFWYEDYATPEDAVRAAKRWLLQGELERTPPNESNVRLASGLTEQPKPTLIKVGW